MIIRDNLPIELIRQCGLHRYQILHTASLGTNICQLPYEPNGFLWKLSDFGLLCLVYLTN